MLQVRRKVSDRVDSKVDSRDIKDDEVEQRGRQVMRRTTRVWLWNVSG